MSLGCLHRQRVLAGALIAGAMGRQQGGPGHGPGMAGCPAVPLLSPGSPQPLAADRPLGRFHASRRQPLPRSPPSPPVRAPLPTPLTAPPPSGPEESPTPPPPHPPAQMHNHGRGEGGGGKGEGREERRGERRERGKIKRAQGCSSPTWLPELRPKRGITQAVSLSVSPL